MHPLFVRLSMIASLVIVMTLLGFYPPAAAAYTPERLHLWFRANGDAAQCGGPEKQAVLENTWTQPIRIDTNSRTGGCELALTLEDWRMVYDGMDFRMQWSVSPGGDGGQCGNQGTHWVPVGLWRGYMSSYIYIDSDDRPGWCNLTFFIENHTYAMLDVQYWPDGDAGQCINSSPQGSYQFMTARAGQPVTIGINTDSRAGGCQLSLRFRTY